MALRFIHFKVIGAYDEPFGRELLFEKLRVERLGRWESQWIDSLDSIFF
jgi:hypothetical protein